ncbi:hypothetical protein [Vibrio diazotrophicus]|uniref:Uncharacterized protein n=1 Tax=Vibrio diazotrophicus TaxID=685 RepID=A0ABX4WBS2_VIBDI|nr:hypothetical protein [Vibrio diazotrophicus]PNH95343.1 hypothetical protein C1O24_15595 [Vibrio diazotrophicus]PNI00282.1 hypothetical protein C1O25_13015 [Vibrio diazotrophicus]
MKEAVLVKVNGEDINRQQKISQEELERIEQAKHEIFEFNREYQLLDYVNENYHSFLCELQNQIHVHNHSGEVLTPFSYDEFIRFINRSLLNLLTSMRTMTDHLEARVKCIYGSESEEWLNLKQLFSQAFDNEFSYCFASKLRNFVQHVGMPPIHFSLDDTFESTQIECHVKLEFSRDELLKSYDSWGAIVKPRLQAQTEFFCVFKFLESLVNSLFDIYARFKKATSLSRVQEARSYILQLINEPKGYASNEYAVGYIDHCEDGKLSIELSWLPATLFGKLELVEQHL